MAKKKDAPASNVTRGAKDPTSAERSRRFRERRKLASVTLPVAPTVAETVMETVAPPVALPSRTVTVLARVEPEKTNDIKVSATVDRDRDATVATVDSATVRHVDRVTVLPPERRATGVTVSTLVAALALATVSAGYSITGLTSIFVGSFWPVVALGVSFELGKLSAVAYLGRHWWSCPPAGRAHRPRIGPHGAQ